MGEGTRLRRGRTGCESQVAWRRGAPGSDGRTARPSRGARLAVCVLYQHPEGLDVPVDLCLGGGGVCKGGQCRGRRGRPGRSGRRLGPQSNKQASERASKQASRQVGQQANKQAKQQQTSGGRRALSSQAKSGVMVRSTRSVERVSGCTWADSSRRGNWCTSLCCGGAWEGGGWGGRGGGRAWVCRSSGWRGSRGGPSIRLAPHPSACSGRLACRLRGGGAPGPCRTWACG